MTLRILPDVGSTGAYELAAPFDALVVNSVEYTCKAIRRISDYLANNEDVKKDVYTANGVNENIYDEDLAEDAYIVSLQSRVGHWVYVPYRYIISYPSVNGIRYRTVMIGVSLPSMPVSQDFSAITEDIKALVTTRLGVGCVVKTVDTSKVVLIAKDTHETKAIERRVRTNGEYTYYATSVKLRKENDALRTKVAELEQFIKAKLA